MGNCKQVWEVPAAGVTQMVGDWAARWRDSPGRATTPWGCQLLETQTEGMAPFRKKCPPDSVHCFRGPGQGPPPKGAAKTPLPLHRVLHAPHCPIFLALSFPTAQCLPANPSLPGYLLSAQLPTC